MDPHLGAWIAPLAAVLRAQARLGDDADMILVQRVCSVRATVVWGASSGGQATAFVDRFNALSASALKTIMFLLGESPATCVPLAICKRILHGGSLAYGSLSFGSVNGRDDIEYGQNKWI